MTGPELLVKSLGRTVKPRTAKSAKAPKPITRGIRLRNGPDWTTVWGRGFGAVDCGGDWIGSGAGAT